MNKINKALLILLCIPQFYANAQSDCFKNENLHSFVLIGLKESLTANPDFKHLKGMFWDNPDTILLIGKIYFSSEPSNIPCSGADRTYILAQNGLEKCRISVNTQCKSFAEGLNTYPYAHETLPEFQLPPKPYTQRILDFKSLTEARTAFNKLIGTQGLLLINEPDWLHFDGKIEYPIFCPEHDKSCFYERESLKNKLILHISSAFPNANFHVSISSGSLNSVEFSILTSNDWGEAIAKTLKSRFLPFKHFHLISLWDF
jgi:hypothetical protein